jgi:hypothetical protein
VRRPLFEKSVVIARCPLAPAPVGVVIRVLRQHRQIVVQLDNHVWYAFIVVAHAGSLMAEDDIAWRNPAASGAYPGPPAAPSPDPAWRPERHDPVPAPRRLPQLDDAAVDEAERRAARVTYAVGLAALAIVFVLLMYRMA